MTAIKGLMRQMEEKYCRHEINYLVWSNKLDLIAVANVLGEVTLHRLNWQRVWHLPPPDKDVLVNMIAWRPDGRAIAIAYNNREVFIVNVEKKIVANTMKMNDDICYIHWVDETTTIDRAKDFYYMMKDTEYVTKLAAFTGSDGNEVPEDSFVKVSDQNDVNFLLIGLQCGEIHISIYGILLCGVVSVPKSLNVDLGCKIISVDIAKDLKHMFVVYETEENDCKRLYCAVYNIPQLSKYSQDLYVLAHECASLIKIIDYMDYAVRSIVEAWENILLNEMMLKLNEYADGKEDGTLSTEFLELLMFGSYSTNMQQFLLKDLTDKHLKRISASIEMSHSSMLKLVIQHLRPCTENLLFELTILRGVMKSSPPTTDPVATDKSLDDCLTSMGVFYVKSNQMLGILEESQLKYKSFFRWLSTVFSLLLGDRVPSNAAEVTQRELKFATKYLHNIDRLNGKPGHQKDELGQFLVDEDLIAQREDRNTWAKLLNDHPALLEGCSLFIPPKFKKCSLIQQQNYFKQQMENFFSHYKNYVTSCCTVKYRSSPIIASTANASYKQVIASVDENKLLICLIKLVNGENYLEIIEFTEKGSGYHPRKITLSLNENSIDTSYVLLDLQFYTKNTLSLLLDKTGENDSSYYTQLPIELVEHSFDIGEKLYLFQHVNKDLRIIENMKVSKIAVSGARKVLVVISDDGHKVRIFEMETDEEEDTNVTTSSVNVTDYTGIGKESQNSFGNNTADLQDSDSIEMSGDKDTNQSTNMDHESTIVSTRNAVDDSEMSIDISNLNISPANVNIISELYDHFLGYE